MDNRIERGMARQLELRAETLQEGVLQIGWKIAFGTEAAQKKYEIDTLLHGFLTDTRRIESGKTLDIADWTQPVIEPEIAVQIGVDLPSGLSNLDDAANAITGLCPAIELVDIYNSPTDVEEILACNIYHRGVVLGTANTDFAGGRTETLVGRVEHNGELIGPVDDVEANTGNLVALVQQVANHLLLFGEHLHAGDQVICGSIIPPIFAKQGDSVVYELAPFEPVSITLA
jgi:2-keto-4-pentenoate hydratase